jgi:hypothetical protein
MGARGTEGTVGSLVWLDDVGSTHEGLSLVKTGDVQISSSGAHFGQLKMV